MSTQLPSSMSAWASLSTTSSLPTTIKKTEIALPTLPPKALLVKVLRAALNPVDYKVSESGLFSRLLGFPLTPGMDCIGRVAATTNPLFQVGDLVVTKFHHPVRQGTVAEYTVVKDSDAVAKVDEAGRTMLDLLSATGVASGTAAVSLKAVKEGDKIFVNGSSGGVGVWMVQMAKEKGAIVVATCSGKNVDFVKSLGADEVIDYTKTDVLEALKSNVSTTKIPFAAAFDNAGHDMSLYYKSHLYLAPNAAYIIIAGNSSCKFLWEAIKTHIIPGFLGGGKRKIVRILNNGGSEEMKWATELILAGKIKLPIVQFGFDEVPKAYESMKSGRTVGKIVVKVADE